MNFSSWIYALQDGEENCIKFLIFECTEKPFFKNDEYVKGWNELFQKL